jgi:Ca2+-binding EF-hand superfamily protein
MDPRAILTAASQMPFHHSFREMDMDSSRDLRKEEIRDFLNKQGDDVNEVEFNTLFSIMDLDLDGSVSFKEAKAHQERELQTIMESLNQPYP